MKKIYFYALFSFVFISAVFYVGWYVDRWMHYKMSYQNLVQSEIRGMVKEECLK